MKEGKLAIIWFDSNELGNIGQDVILETMTTRVVFILMYNLPVVIKSLIWFDLIQLQL